MPSRVLPYYGTAFGFAFGGLYASSYSASFGWSSEAYGPVYPTEGAEESGSLRLLVEPKTAQVYVDGHYVGVIDDFDGMFEHLDLDVGPHHIELRESGYDALVVDVIIQPHHKTTYRGNLLPVQR